MFVRIYLCLFLFMLVLVPNLARATEPSEEMEEDLDSKIEHLLRTMNRQDTIPRKRSFLTHLYKQSKRAFHIKTYFDALVQNDGSILLVPKDVNKNHYFIG